MQASYLVFKTNKQAPTTLMDHVTWNSTLCWHSQIWEMCLLYLLCIVWLVIVISKNEIVDTQPMKLHQSKIRQSGKVAITFETMMQFQNPLRLRMSWTGACLPVYFMTIFTLTYWDWRCRKYSGGRGWRCLFVKKPLAVPGSAKSGKKKTESWQIYLCKRGSFSGRSP